MSFLFEYGATWISHHVVHKYILENILSNQMILYGSMNGLVTAYNYDICGELQLNPHLLNYKFTTV